MHLIGITHEIKNQTTENKDFPFGLVEMRQLVWLTKVEFICLVELTNNPVFFLTFTSNKCTQYSTYYEH